MLKLYNMCEGLSKILKGGRRKGKDLLLCATKLFIRFRWNLFELVHIVSLDSSLIHWKMMGMQKYQGIELGWIRSEDFYTTPHSYATRQTDLLDHIFNRHESWSDYPMWISDTLISVYQTLIKTIPKTPHSIMELNEKTRPTSRSATLTPQTLEPPKHHLIIPPNRICD